MKETDGTPDDVYVTSRSGAGIGDKFTGENFVVVTVPAAAGLRGYQLGLLSDGVCTVKITVSRIGESEIHTQEITIGNNNDKVYTLTKMENQRSSNL